MMMPPFTRAMLMSASGRRDSATSDEAMNDEARASELLMMIALLRRYATLASGAVTQRMMRAMRRKYAVCATDSYDECDVMLRASDAPAMMLFTMPLMAARFTHCLLMITPRADTPLMMMRRD